MTIRAPGPPAPVSPVPLAPEAFADFEEPAGPASLRLQIEPLAVELHGLPEDVADTVHLLHAPFVSHASGLTGAASASAPAPLQVQVLRAPFDYFIEPEFHRKWEVYRAVTAYDGSVFRMMSYRLASWFDPARQVGQVALAQGTFDPAPRALENFLRCATAWLAFRAGGFFLHGASIVRGDRCDVFYGPSGAGKSTLAAMSRQGRVLSDDLTPILPAAGGLVAIGCPFRGTYRIGEPVVGRFPIAGFYRLRKDVRTFIEPGNAGCFADLLGNLPWIVDQLAKFPELADSVHAATRGSRFFYLHFNKEEDFWPAVDRGPVDQRTSR
jgi:hypothetical protein